MKHDALESLLSGSLDYAGMFPPAELSLDDALRNYLNYQQHPQSWLLGRFVCPVTRLAECAARLREMALDPNLRLALLGQFDKAGETASAGWKPAWEASAPLGLDPDRQHWIEAYESPLPLESPHDPVALADFLKQIRESLCNTGLAPLVVFLEFGSWGALGAALVTSAETLVAQGNHAVRFGWKIRLGGALPWVAPTASDLARFIAACRNTGCIWKATAGLHQPLFGGDRGRGTCHFGFFTLLAAATLAEIHDLPPATIQQILKERDVANFHLDADTFAWRTFSATCAQIAQARQRSLISFGSCSFEEPLAGLRELHLLEGIPSHA